MRKWIIIIITLLLIGYLGYNYLYQDHRNIENEKPEFSLSAQDIAKEFLESSKDAEQKYLNKTIEIQGVVTEKNETDITINNTVFCAFNEATHIETELNSNVIIKGRFIGYDDLLEVIKIDQTTITK